MRRGEPMIRLFGNAIAATLSEEKNAAKGDWRDDEIPKLFAKWMEETLEVAREYQIYLENPHAGTEGLLRELPDQGAAAGMLYEKLIDRLMKEAAA